LEKVLTQKKKHYQIKNVDEFEVSYYEPLIREANQILKDLIRETESIVTKHLNIGSRFVIEGAHGALLDLDHGTYPMVTASNSTVGGLLVGAGMPPIKLTKVVGVFKAYQTRVGAGGMPTELNNEQGDLIRERGHEYGTTTGRPRRVGYFDGVAAKYAHQINGFTDIAITRLDTLAVVGDLKICHAYNHNGTKTNQFNTDNTFLSECKAIYEVQDQLIGWNEDVSNVKSFEDLPKSVQNYTKHIMTSFPGAKMSYLGVGPSRKDLIEL